MRSTSGSAAAAINAQTRKKTGRSVIYAVKSEGMFPYETHYVLATDEEVERLHEREAAMDEDLCG